MCNINKGRLRPPQRGIFLKCVRVCVRQTHSVLLNVHLWRWGARWKRLISNHLHKNSQNPRLQELQWPTHSHTNKASFRIRVRMYGRLQLLQLATTHIRMITIPTLRITYTNTHWGSLAIRQPVGAKAGRGVQKSSCTTTTTTTLSKDLGIQMCRKTDRQTDRQSSIELGCFWMIDY